MYHLLPNCKPLLSKNDILRKISSFLLHFDKGRAILFGQNILNL